MNVLNVESNCRPGLFGFSFSSGELELFVTLTPALLRRGDGDGDFPIAAPDSVELVDESGISNEGRNMFDSPAA